MEFNKDKFIQVIESIKECYFEVDLKGNFTYVNDSLCNITGYSREELLGLNYKYIADEENKKKVYEGFNSVYRTGEPLTNIEYEFRNKSEKKLIGETSVYLKYDSNGNKIGFYGIFRDVTERKEREIQFKKDLEQLVNLRTQELKASEEKYSNLFHQSNDAIFLHDFEGNIIDVNQRALDQFGYTRAEILKLKVPELHPTSEIEESKKAFEEISKKGVIRFEISFKKKNGKIFLAEVSSSLFDMGGKQVIQGNVRDITFRVLTEKMLKESEEKYRNMINHLDLGFYQLKWNGLLLNHNPRFCEILGYNPSENLKNKDVHDFWQKPEERNAYLKELEENGYVKNYLVHAKKKNGENIVVQLNSHILDRNEGETIIIQGLISDITEKFELEQKLKESEERYRNLIESVPFSIALIDQQGTIVYCNPPIEKLLGYRQDELIGYKFKDLPAVHPKYIPLLLKRFQKVLKGEMLPPLEIELYHKGGYLIWIMYQSTLVKLGNQVLLQTVIHDITEQKKADLLIEEELIKLKELDQLRKDLISRVSHELKTPLVSVCGAAELLLDLFIGEFKGETKELLEMIEKGGKRLKYLVDNLVDITRIEYNKFKLDKETSDLSKVIRDCTKELMYLIKMREINLELNLLDNLFLKFDKVRIEQVILNLLSNAIKNTPPNGKITITSLKIDNCVELKINDTGIGLTREEIEKLFTRFGKIERYGDGLEYVDIQGTGLGLYISKEIIDLHKGEIWVESAGRDRGSTFIIILPI
ncbi:MAG: PAS domain S-box protein [Promethearchaeota archaeon]|nr:MAG: PAS domain S-box protein [Candidatus Lokiarchaeota archaeon]